MRIRKRDGSIQQFDPRKIRRAILMAFAEVHPGKPVEMSPLESSVLAFLDGREVDSDIFDIETIQDVVEQVLMAHQFLDVANAYVIYRHERAKLRASRQKPDDNAPADYIHLAKYAKYRHEWKRREVYAETVNRVKDMHLKRWPELSTQIEDAFGYVYDKKVLPSMRSMQFAGAATIAHNARMYNCAFTLIDRVRSFQETLYLLLCGCGVGFSVQWQHVDKLPRLGRVNEKSVVHYTIPDTIEGWADAVGMLFDSYVNGYCVEFSYHLIRPEGSPLKTSGGLAPGHLPLKLALEAIRNVLHVAQGRKLRPIECHDIVCFCAEAVLAGGIRRSSLISIFSPEDTEMVYAKSHGVFEPNKLNAQREMANNSATFLRSKVDRASFDRVIRVAQENFGDPGFYFTDNLDYGTNPCGEIGLNPTIDGKTGFSFCNLTIVNAATVKDESDLIERMRAAAFIGTLQASYTDLEYLGGTTIRIAQRDALIGVSMSGMMDNPAIAFNPELQRKAARTVLHENVVTAMQIGINACERATTVKPDGTCAWELGGIGSGIHPRHARRFFRRFTANPLEPVAQYFRKYNPHMVDVKPNGDLSIVFPIEIASDAMTVKDMPALDFIERVMSTYDNWIVPGTVSMHSPGLTHNVSCTVTVKDDEMQSVLDTIWDNRHRITAMAFAPYMLDKKFPYAPNEAVETPADEVRWNYYIVNYKPVPWSEMKEEWNASLAQLEPACGGGSCEVR